jgi:hypothetical protein
MSFVLLDCANATLDTDSAKMRGKIAAYFIVFLFRWLWLVVLGSVINYTSAPHRHEVAGQAEAIGTVDRQIVSTELQNRIGQLPGSDRHIARSRGGMIVRGNLARPLHGATLCFCQGERRSAARTVAESANAPINETRTDIPENRDADRCARLRAVKGDSMKPPDSVEQHRLRKMRNDDELGNQEVKYGNSSCE